MDKTELAQWVRRLATRYQNVIEICVTGSRELPKHRRPKARWAEWEIVVFLDEEACYEERTPGLTYGRCFRVVENTALEIASDHDLRSPVIDLFFFLPRDIAVNWRDRDRLSLPEYTVKGVWDDEAMRLARKFGSSRWGWSRRRGFWPDPAAGTDAAPTHPGRTDSE